MFKKFQDSINQKVQEVKDKVTINNAQGGEISDSASQKSASQADSAQQPQKVTFSLSTMHEFSHEELQ